MWLLIVDAHSKWLEVFQMDSTASSATIQCLRDVFSRFGLPDRIVFLIMLHILLVQSL